tara:strand:- start:355 stop:594 length:240 start_codon:yes stop_codon:yes gene_type:complete
MGADRMVVMWALIAAPTSTPKHHHRPWALIAAPTTTTSADRSANHTRPTTTTSADRNANHDRQPQPPTTRGYGSANHDR